MSNISFANGADLSATNWVDANGLHIRTYYQDSNNLVQEMCYDTKTGWTAGSSPGTGAPHAGLAATSWVDSAGAHLRVYYQDVNNNVQEACWDQSSGTGWVKGVNLGAASKDGGIGITSWLDTPGIFVRLYYVGGNGKPVEQCYDPATGWYVGAFPN